MLNAYANKTFGDDGIYTVVGNGITVELWHGVDDTITAEILTDTSIGVYVFGVDYIGIDTHPNMRLTIHGLGEISIPITFECD